MTLNELYKASVLKLGNIENAEFDVRIMLKKVLSFSETDLLVNKNLALTEKQVEVVDEMLEKRLSGLPVQYIIGEWDFYGITFKVNENVLIPRPETEILCEYVIDYLKDIKSPVVADLCSGSGCIGITVKKYVDDAVVFMVEKSFEAAEVCLENMRNIIHRDQPVLINDDIFLIGASDILPSFDVIISNPPYIRSSEISSLQPEVLHEPIMALDGGDDGLDFYRLISDKWIDLLKEDGIFAFECGEDQAEEIKTILEEKNLEVSFIKDYNNVDRFVIGKRRKI